MHKIETKTDFNQWCKDVNFAVNSKICDLQDSFARTDISDTKAFFIDMDQSEKELTVFSIQKAMGSATLFEFIKMYARVQAEKYIQEEWTEIDDRWTKLLKAESDFQADKNKLKATIEALKSQNAELVNDNDTMSITTANLYNRIHSLESEMDDLKDELTKLWAFESHIKGMLQPA